MGLELRDTDSIKRQTNTLMYKNYTKSPALSFTMISVSMCVTFFNQLVLQDDFYNLAEVNIL